jgi:hypothetical protein
MDPIRRISIRARGMSNAATRGRTHVSTRPSAQIKAKFSLASGGASTHVPIGFQTRTIRRSDVKSKVRSQRGGIAQIVIWGILSCKRTTNA